MRRLKRYIRACGAHRNYKKLLGSCRSRKERLSVLRAELEALGMKGEAGCALGAAEYCLVWVCLGIAGHLKTRGLEVDGARLRTAWFSGRVSSWTLGKVRLQ